jgi:hypothetical protein
VIAALGRLPYRSGGSYRTLRRPRRATHRSDEDHVAFGYRFACLTVRRDP